jgi:hypothetical protein
VRRTKIASTFHKTKHGTNKLWVNSRLRRTISQNNITNCRKHQTRPKGGQPLGDRWAGRGLAAPRAYHYEPLATPYYPSSVRLIMKLTFGPNSNEVQACGGNELSSKSVAADDNREVILRSHYGTKTTGIIYSYGRVPRSGRP